MAEETFADPIQLSAICSIPHTPSRNIPTPQTERALSPPSLSCSAWNSPLPGA